MLVYAVADIHDREERVDWIEDRVARLAPDVVVVAGDIARNGRSAPRLLGRLDRMPVPVLAIGGNTDRRRIEDSAGRYPNVSSLHLREVAMDGIPFVGVSGTLPLPFDSRMGLWEGRITRRLEALVGIQSVLVAHPPPRGTLDRVFGRFPAGCRRLGRLVAEREPRLLICGHIHEQAGFAFLGRTLVVNCSMGRDRAGALIELGKDGAPRVEVLEAGGGGRRRGARAGRGDGAH